MSAAATQAEGVGYTWTQTKEDLTLQVSLPAGTSARSIRCDVVRGSLNISILGNAEPLVQGDLHEAISDTAWFVDEGRLIVELEKKVARFWPCTIKGHPQVDVKALVAQEKKDKEPVYKPQHGEYSTTATLHFTRADPRRRFAPYLRA